MPKRKFKKKRRNQGRRNNRLMLMKSPVPQKMITKFRYSTTISVNPGAAGSVAEWVFAATGLYDPDITGVGHQPRGFDQLVGVLYDHYVVLGAKLTARFDNSLNSYPILGMVKIQDSTQTTTTRTDWQEDPYVVRKAISGNGGPSMGTVVKKCSTGAFLGRTSVLSDPELKGSNAANPTENAFFHVGACAISDSVDLNVVVAEVEIEFITALIEPRNPAQS